MPHKRCSCGKRVIYNVPGETKPICCSECKTDGMIDVISKRCPCGSLSPNFNVSGETKGMYCKSCKAIDMINVVSKRCPCGKRMTFNIPGEFHGISCKKCKTDEMIDVVSKRCLCGNHPLYNLPDQKKPICCSSCKTVEMINVVSKRCSCGKQPYFNVSGETKGKCCVECKTPEMIDVVSKKCSCGKQPSFNVPGETKGVCCSKCKTDDMINVMSKICPGYAGECPVITYISNGNEYCMSCDPNESRRKQYKRYEEAFFAYVKDKIDVHKREFRVTFDPTETAKKFARVDGIVFGDGVIVCLEVDENGHQEYECDEHRMHLVTAELLQKHPGHVVSWVRVNPTTVEKRQQSKTSKMIRERRFEDVVMIVNDILKTQDTRVVYIGF